MSAAGGTSRGMTGRILVLLAALAAPPAFAAGPPPAKPAPPPAPAAPAKPPAALLQGLDKVTARVSTFEAPIGQTVKFGTLAIAALTCQKHPPEESPEAAAFLKITEVRPEGPEQVFSGWMFASSPALHPLQHPVYDVWVIDCK